MLCYAIIDKVCQTHKNLKVNNKISIKLQIGNNFTGLMQAYSYLQFLFCIFRGLQDVRETRSNKTILVPNIQL